MIGSQKIYSDNKEILSVLVIEENLGTSKIVNNLKNQGFDVIFASSHRDGLKLLKNGNFDAVLLDYNFFPNNGKDELKYYKEIRKGNSYFSVILVSASQKEDITIEIMEQQSENILLKTIDFSVLGTYLKQRIENRAKFKLITQKTEPRQDIHKINIFENFIILKNSIPMYIEGEWSKDIENKATTTKNTFDEQILMSSMLNAIQSLSGLIFGHAVTELSLQNSRILFKQKGKFLCGVKINNSDYELISARGNQNKIIYNCLTSILNYLQSISKKRDILLLQEQQKNIIIHKLRNQSKKFNLGSKKSFFQRI